MATDEEAIGSGVAAQALALASIARLVNLGHADVLEEVEADALGIVMRSIKAGKGFDKEKAKDHAKLQLLGIIETAKYKASLKN